MVLVMMVKVLMVIMCGWKIVLGSSLVMGKVWGGLCSGASGAMKKGMAGRSSNSNVSSTNPFMYDIWDQRHKQNYMGS